MTPPPLNPQSALSVALPCHLTLICVQASQRSGARAVLSALGLNPGFITNRDCKMI